MEAKITQYILQGEEDLASRMIHDEWGVRMPAILHRHHNIAMEDAQSVFGDATYEVMKRVATQAISDFTFAYFRAICRNMAIKVFRQNQNRGKHFVAFENSELWSLRGEDGFEQQDNKELVEKGLAKLDETCRDLIQKHILEDMSHREIAQEMSNIANENTSKSMFYKCRKKLREIFRQL